jgi:hypothetical protein
MEYISPFCRQWYKYNFAELLDEFLFWSPHKTVKAFFEERYETYNSYIRTRTKWRHNLKVYITLGEFGIWWKYKIYGLVTLWFEPWEKFCDPASIVSINNISAYACIKRRRYIKRTKKKFNGYVNTINFLTKTDPSGNLYQQFFDMLFDTWEVWKYMETLRRHITESLPTRADEYKSLAVSRRSKFREVNGY